MSAIVMRSMYIANQKNNEEKLRNNLPDILIEPEVGEYNIYDFDQHEKIIQSGRDKAMEFLPSIQKIINS